MTVASVDQATGRTVLISLPRNMERAPFPASSPMHKKFPKGFRCPDHTCMLNAVYTYAMTHKELYPKVKNPGAQATKEAIEGVTGLTVNYWALIDLKGFEDLVDAVGGITMDVYRRVPIGGGHAKLYGYVEAGKNRHLDGREALWFARSRSDSSDWDRIVRQKCVMNAMLKQLDPLTVLTKFNGIAKASGEIVATDIPSSQISTMLDLAQKAKEKPVGSLAVVPPLLKYSGDPDFPQDPGGHRRPDREVRGDGRAEAGRDRRRRRATRRPAPSRRRSPAARARPTRARRARTPTTSRRSAPPERRGPERRGGVRQDGPMISDWPGVTVVMPVLNEETHLEAAVSGVLSQDYPGALEVVLAVGPSRDATRAIADGLAARDPRVRVVDNPASRTPHALNLGRRRGRARRDRAGRRARDAHRRLRPPRGRAARGDRRGERRRRHGRAGLDALRGGRRGGVHDQARPRRQLLPPRGVRGGTRRDGVPRGVPARGAAPRSAGSTRRCTARRTGSSTTGCWPAGAPSGSRPSCGSPTGRAPRCAPWPSRCTTPASGAARSSGATPTPRTSATSPRPSPPPPSRPGRCSGLAGSLTGSRLLRLAWAAPAGYAAVIVGGLGRHRAVDVRRRPPAPAPRPRRHPPVVGRRVPGGAARGRPSARLSDRRDASQRTTRTGQCAWATTCWLVEPISRPTKPPWPRVPTTTRSASSLASTRDFAGWPSTTRVVTAPTSDPAPRPRSRPAAAPRPALVADLHRRRSSRRSGDGGAACHAVSATSVAPWACASSAARRRASAWRRTRPHRRGPSSTASSRAPAVRGQGGPAPGGGCRPLREVDGSSADASATQGAA